MNEQLEVLRFVWWNVESLAHYHADRAGERQWPLLPEAYQAKCDRIDRVLTEFFGTDPPELLAFAELTNQAAVDLRDRLFPKYEVMSLDQYPRSQLQVAFVYDPSKGFAPQNPIVVPLLPRGTRPMAVLDFVGQDYRIRFIGCHWTARFSKESKETRSTTARFLFTLDHIIVTGTMLTATESYLDENGVQEVVSKTLLEGRSHQ